jgi:phospholipid/cholesterol/gamma-HCH transport system substrate-binding protein
MVTGFRSTLVKFLAFAVIALAMLVLLYNTMVNGVPGGTRTFTADFANVSGLETGDDIRVAGVRVGKVDRIGLIPGGAAVTFELQDSQPILANTQMVMRYQNLLGQRYLSLVQPSRHGAALPAGATIPRSRTSPGFDLTELLNGFRPLLQTLQPSAVNQLAASLIEVLQGEGGTVQQLLEQTTKLTDFVADRDQVYGQVLTNLTPVLQDLAGQGTAISSTVHELRLLMTGLADDRKSIGASITGLSHLITHTSTLLEEARKPVVLDTALFRKVAVTLDSQRSLLTKALHSFGDTFGDLGRFSSYTSAGNVYICTMWLKTALGQLNLNGAADGPWSRPCAGRVH